MNIEELLTTELGGRADRLALPEVATAGLERAGRRERTRRRGFAAGGAAALVAVVVAGVLATTSGSAGPRLDPAPQPTGSPPPSGTADQLPYRRGDTLYVGETTIEVDPQYALTYANGTAVVGGQNEGPWFRVVDGALVEIPTGRTTFGVTLSADGRMAAWVNRVDSRTERVVLWDFATDREAGRLDVPVGREFAGRLLVSGIDERGRVFWTTNSLEDATMWRPGSSPVPVTGLPGAVLEVWPAGGVVADSPEPGAPSYEEAPGVFGLVADDGAFEAAGDIAHPSGPVWAPGGRYRTTYVLPGEESDGVTVRANALVLDVETGLVELPVPAGLVSPSAVAWVSATEVMLVADQVPTTSSARSLVRCDVEEPSCEVVVDGLGVNAQLPDGY